MLSKKELKEKLSDHIKQIANVNDLEIDMDKKVNNIYAYLERREQNYGNVNLDIMKLNKIAVEGFKNNTYTLKLGDVLLFQTSIFPINGKWKVTDITNNSVTVGKLTKEGNISNRANKRTFDKNTIENCVRNYSELDTNFRKTKRVIKEVS